MSAEETKTGASIAKCEGANQRFSPTNLGPNVWSNVENLVLRKGEIVRLEGKKLVRKFDVSVISIHSLNGRAIIQTRNGIYIEDIR